MNPSRAIWAIARADFLERVRRYSFFLTLFFAGYLGCAAATGRITLRLGDYRGLYTSAWIGTMVAMVTTTFVSLAGFYVIKNAVDRDRQTGVGQILATTPLSKTSYMVGKLLSNFGVLASMVVILALGALAMQSLAAEDPRLDTWALLSPFLFFSLPFMALTAALALVFEALPILRSGAGNVIWFFAWAFGIALPKAAGIAWLDPAGLFTVMDNLQPAARNGIPGYEGGISLIVADQAAKIATGFHWNGTHWSSALIAGRLAWCGAALGLALFAALVFDRFDPARAVLQGFRRRIREDAVQTDGVPRAANAAAPQVHLTPLDGGTQASGFARIFAAELRLALQGYRWWWYAVAASLLVAQCSAPLDAARGPVLALAWIWPILIWSGLGSRETRFGTGQLLFSCAWILPRQLPAAWLAAVAVTAAAGAGAGVRLMLAGQSAGVAAWAAAVLFVPALALALGVWSGTSKLFEGAYTALWYIGPLNHTPGLDFTGGGNGASTLRYAGVYLLLAGVLLATAVAGRQRQLRGS